MSSGHASAAVLTPLSLSPPSHPAPASPVAAAVEYVRVLPDERVALVKYATAEAAALAVGSLDGVEVLGEVLQVRSPPAAPRARYSAAIASSPGFAGWMEGAAQQPTAPNWGAARGGQPSSKAAALEVAHGPPLGHCLCAPAGAPLAAADGTCAKSSGSHGWWPLSTLEAMGRTARSLLDLFAGRQALAPQRE
jgi:hypothetical protein